MTYPFVAAKWFSKGALTEVRGLVIHFAEGGGTVSYFTNTTKDVSAHFVLQYDGTIVQMVRDEDADHCQHISYGSWAYPGGLNRANGVAVLGSDVMDQQDPTRVNRYVQAIEIEGFRATGPNPAQTSALATWVAERRTKYPAMRGLLGHGDVQDKACPGALIPWALLGGHGPFTEEPMGLKLTQPTSGPVTGILTVPKGTKAIRVSDGVQTTSATLVIRSATTAQVLGGSGGYLVNLNGDELHFVYNGNLPAGSFVPSTVPPDPQALADARAAGRESFRQDVEAIP